MWLVLSARNTIQDKYSTKVGYQLKHREDKQPTRLRALDEVELIEVVTKTDLSFPAWLKGMEFGMGFILTIKNYHYLHYMGMIYYYLGELYSIGRDKWT